MKFNITIIAVILILTSCSGLLNMDARPPVIVKTVPAFTIGMNDSLALNMRMVEAYDINEDAMSLVVLDGLNYSVAGLVVIPDSGFTGELSVEIKVKDETGLLSESGSILVTVLADSPSIQPLVVGSEWIFTDTFYTIDSVASSRLSVTGTYSGSVPGITGDIAELQWSNADSLNLTYRYHNSDSGAIRVGAESPTHSQEQPQLKLKYPVSAGETWEFSPLEYDTTAKRFFLDSRVTEMTCRDSSVYVTVPAGIFECVAYEYSYGYVPFGSSTPSGDTVTVILYYSVGVGYVQNETFLNTTLVTKKVLVDFHIEERN